MTACDRSVMTQGQFLWGSVRSHLLAEKLEEVSKFFWTQVARASLPPAPLCYIFFRMTSACHLTWTHLGCCSLLNKTALSWGNSTKKRFQWLSLALEEKAYVLSKTFSLCCVVNWAVKYVIMSGITDYLHSSWKPFQRTFHKALAMYVVPWEPPVANGNLSVEPISGRCGSCLSA